MEPTGTFSATHAIPPTGARSWERADPTAPESAALAPGLDVAVIERTGDWARVRCSNGFTAWVDGRTLVERAGSSPTGGMGGMAGTVIDRLAPLDFSFSRPLVAAVVIAATAFLPWTRGGITFSGFNIPIVFLLNNKTKSQGGLSVGWLLLLAAVAGGVGVVLAHRDILRRIAGFGTAAVAVLYVVQLQSALSSAGGGGNILKVLGYAVPIALAAGLVLALTPPDRPQG